MFLCWLDEHPILEPTASEHDGAGDMGILKQDSLYTWTADQCRT
jgi:hypothetical protein